MAKYNKYVLLKKNSLKNPVLTDSRSKSAFKNLSIPAKALVNDNGNDRWIINARGHGVWQDPKSVTNIRLFEKPQFTDGILIVPTDNKRLIEYLDSYPGNIDSPYRRKGVHHDIYMKWDSGKVAQDNIKAQDKILDVLIKVANMDFKKEIIPMLMRFGYMRDWDNTSEAVYQLRAIAQKDPDHFLKVAEDNSMTERASEIHQAQQFGIIEFARGQWLRKDSGAVICSVPPTRKDKVEYFAEFSFNKGAGDWQNIAAILDKYTSIETRGKEVKQKVVEEVEGQASDYNSYTSDELLQTAKELGISKLTPSTKTWHFGDLEIKAPKAELAGILDKDEDTRAKLIEEIIKASND